MIPPVVAEKEAVEKGIAEKGIAEKGIPEKGFAIVAEVDAASPRERFEKRAAEIAHAAELHVRRMMEAESALLEERPVPPGRWSVDPENRDTVPFGLKRRVVLRVPVFRCDEALPEESASDLRRIRALMAQLALELIDQVIEINRYFAAAGLVPSPELNASGRANQPERDSAGNSMSGGSVGSSLHRRA